LTSAVILKLVNYQTVAHALADSKAVAALQLLQVTFVVVSKSHGTRLFPDPSDANSSDGRTGNTKPGTVVDTGITVPLKYEFFLNSHAGIQVRSNLARGCACLHRRTSFLCLVYY
jgi:eukaryotic translation initiation factor 2C